MRLIKDRATNTSKGFGFVKFKDREHAKEAVHQMNGKIIGDRKIGVLPSDGNNTLWIGEFKDDWKYEEILDVINDQVVGAVKFDLIMDSGALSRFNNI